MRAGARLLLHYCNGKATWQLNPGGEVAPKTALNVIKRIDICRSATASSRGVASQTYRFIEN